VVGVAQPTPTRSKLFSKLTIARRKEKSEPDASLAYIPQELLSTVCRNEYLKTTANTI
jgi:hypothetical protein